MCLYRLYLVAWHNDALCVAAKASATKHTITDRHLGHTRSNLRHDTSVLGACEHGDKQKVSNFYLELRGVSGCLSVYLERMGVVA